ncbi:hypothetical protein ACFSSA_14345 [Luteolibacter algae]|uniref:Uncharacterized protein n=1 Tax=Luteolibacter algae TaxID=454151 RepID=A0ABW5DBD6_9BACT
MLHKPIFLNLAPDALVGISFTPWRVTAPESAEINPETHSSFVPERENGFACELNEHGVATTVLVAPSKISEVVRFGSNKPDHSCGQFITETDPGGRIVYHTGHDWEKAGASRSMQKWAAHLNNF